jgi:glycosyltransferase involved in cell wall biosynthesis
MRILHVFRTPVGGLFRHVRDLARGQRALGHDVGILCDSNTGSGTAERLLAEALPYCSLGITRIPMSRLPGLGDLTASLRTIHVARQLGPAIIHCHGAKGGLHGRLAGRRLGIPTVYAPHGGSLHYRWSSPAGAVFLAAEWLLARLGSGLHFVCRFERDSFAARIGVGGKPHAVIHNGLWPEEFTAAPPAADATDVLFIGDMRRLKGTDVLIDALAIAARHRPVTACLVGDGDDLDAFRTQARALCLEGNVSFPGRMAARDAFGRGRLLVLPSRAESFPYVVLEAMAAGVPVIASDVGGIGEMLEASQLVPADDAEVLAERILAALADPQAEQALAVARSQRISTSFTADAMVKNVLGLYALVGAK